MYIAPYSMPILSIKSECVIRDDINHFKHTFIKWGINYPNTYSVQNLARLTRLITILEWQVRCDMNQQTIVIAAK